jgi:hypothetical protein
MCHKKRFNVSRSKVQCVAQHGSMFQEARFNVSTKQALMFRQSKVQCFAKQGSMCHKTKFNVSTKQGSMCHTTRFNVSRSKVQCFLKQNSMCHKTLFNVSNSPFPKLKITQIISKKIKNSSKHGKTFHPKSINHLNPVPVHSTTQ